MRARTHAYDRRTMLHATLSRRTLLSSLAAAGLSHRYAISSSAAQESPVRVCFADWILNFYPSVADINTSLSSVHPIYAEKSPVEPGGQDRFLAEAMVETSSWDMYVGATPFLDVAALVEGGAIEPWDPYLDSAFISDLPQPVLSECTYNGKLYSVPVFYDVVALAGHTGILEKAGIDPAVEPSNWDAVIANADQIQKSGAAPYGFTFDSVPWRSLVPIALSLDADVFREDGRFNWTSDTTVLALEILRRLTEHANPDVAPMNVNSQVGTPFLSEEAAYSLVNHAVDVIFAGYWKDPLKLGFYALPGGSGTPGRTAFWDTSAVLLTYGSRKESAAWYIQEFARDERLWRNSLAGITGKAGSAVGQLPPYRSIIESYKQNPPDWLVAAPWAVDVWNYGVENGVAIPPSNGVTNEYLAAMWLLAPYLNGESKDARAVLEEVEKTVSS